MSLHHFYLDDQVIANEGEAVFPLRLTPADAKHARVLRLAAGEHLAVVDAVQDYFECEIVSFSDAVPLVRIARHLESETSRPTVILIQGLAKADKMETVIRHATELGVSAFIPFVSERSIVKLDAKKASARTERWQAIAKSAAMQSGQQAVPEVHDLMPLDEVCDKCAQATALLVCWEEAPQTARLDEALKAGLEARFTPAEDARVAVVVGPEGGLTEHEVQKLLSCCDTSALISLGASILRTETAGIVAPALVFYELEQQARAAAERRESAINLRSLT